MARVRVGGTAPVWRSPWGTGRPDGVGRGLDSRPPAVGRFASRSLLRGVVSSAGQGRRTQPQVSSYIVLRPHRAVALQPPVHGNARAWDERRPRKIEGRLSQLVRRQEQEKQD
jgi:hypothetical protein